MKADFAASARALAEDAVLGVMALRRSGADASAGSGTQTG